jgi:CDP-2,3-bis-(O-geranylgeranyl)-sn-glycerol synthase
MNALAVILAAIAYIFPAYAANFSAAVWGGGMPIDGGRTLGDGRRILGNGKTFRGLFIALVLGTLVGAAEGALLAGTEFCLGSLEFYTLLGFLLALGAMTGDMVASFFKRRLGYKPGQMLPLVDQLDFIAGALVFGSILYFPSIEMIIVLIIVTPILHLLLNVLGYLLKMKKVPW